MKARPTVLVTGPTGNVGRHVVACLVKDNVQVFAGTRDGQIDPVTEAQGVSVDFATGTGPQRDFDAIFLLRPPQIADPEVFVRFLQPYDRSTRIVFLSVAGAERQSYLPHAKIEKRIRMMGFPHVFVRPGYFMDNLLTTLWDDLAEDRRIFLPAGQLALDWVSARDVGHIAAAALTKPHVPDSIEVSSGELTGFDAALDRVNAVAGTALRYEPASLGAYIKHARRRGQPWSFIGLMLLLHYLPRFRQRHAGDARITKAWLGRAPETLKGFATRHLDRFAALGPPPGTWRTDRTKGKNAP